MTLVARLSRFFMTMLTIVLIIFSVSLFLIVANHLWRQTDERLNTMLNTVSNTIEVGTEGLEYERGTHDLTFDSFGDSDQFAWLISDDQGTILDRSRSGATDLFLADASPRLKPLPIINYTILWRGSNWRAGQRFIVSDRGLPDRESSTSAQDDERVDQALSVTAGVSLIPVRTTLSQLAIALAGVSISIWVIAKISCQSVCRRALIPVYQMAAASREIDANDPIARLPVIATHDELADLNFAFNSLLDRLQIAFERQRRFTADASHQLRTPLTVILGQIEVALRRERSEDEYRTVLEKVKRSAEHLTGLTKSLLFLARAETEGLLPAKESIGLPNWLIRQIETWSQHHRAGDIVFDGANFEEYRIQTQPTFLGELLNILIDNACKYSEPGTPIVVRLQRIENSMLLWVEDKGFGIDADDLPLIFEPLHRSESTRRRGIDGVGLGLSIAKRLAEAIGATLTVVSEPSQGSCFSLRIENVFLNLS